jgi:hypothetical protein
VASLALGLVLVFSLVETGYPSFTHARFAQALERESKAGRGRLLRASAAIPPLTWLCPPGTRGVLPHVGSRGSQAENPSEKNDAVTPFC